MSRGRTIFAVVAGIAFVGVVAGIALRSQHALEAGLPPRFECRDAHDAGVRLARWLGKRGGEMTPILGTGSMAPFIPPAAPGKNPRTTIVAYAALRPNATFADIERGNAIIYEYLPEPGSQFLHCAAEKDKDGWIMTGLANPLSESWTRVTEKNFKAIVAAVFVWPQVEVYDRTMPVAIAGKMGGAFQ